MCITTGLVYVRVCAFPADR